MRRFALALVLLLAACAEPTAYAPADPAARSPEGFAEFMIEPARWRVTFSGNSITSREAVETAMLHRAAEITLREGGEWFRIVDEDTETEVRQVAVASGFGPWPYRRGGFGRFAFGPHYGLDTLETREVRRHSAFAEIIVGGGERPDDPLAYDAASVIAAIGPRLKRPEAG